MQQVLFHVPFLGVPIYGYGFMLFCAYIGCTWLAVHLARREGYPKEPMQDLTVWLFIFGIIGARITFIIINWGRFANFGQFFAVWDGGLVFYGSIPGAVVGYALSNRFQLSKHGVSHWKLADIVAPCLCLGLCLGRTGCLLNGCCYGNVACSHCPEITFPFSSPPRATMVERGHQTPAGFLTDSRDWVTVRAVEPMSPWAATLKPNDVIRRVIAHSSQKEFDAVEALGKNWPRGEHSLELDVVNANGKARLGPAAPRTIGLHPTQIYESISMALLLFLLLSYYPYKSRDGSLMVIFMLGYGVHRFLNEMLRTDTDPVAFGLTLSQNVSVAVLIAAVVLGAIVWQRRGTGNPPAPLMSAPLMTNDEVPNDERSTKPE